MSISVHKILIHIIKAVFLLTTVLLGKSLYAQEVVMDIKQSVEDYSKAGLKEKLFVHTDKDFYLTGEIMWFKVYCADAGFHKPLDVSKVVYVEILDTANKPVLQAKIGMKEGAGQGSFFMPQSLTSGYYHLRAYTRWMQNFDASYYFKKKITIVNIKKFPVTKPTNTDVKYNLEFFPEGGNLVNGLPSKMAFKATNSYGESFEFTGYLLDNADTLLKFSAFHAGMGNFFFTPLVGHQYTVYIKPVGAEAFKKELPAIYKEGITMQVEDADNGTIAVAAATNNMAATDIYLVAHTRESVRVATKGSFQAGRATFRFNKSVLGDGISHITLFNQARQPVCERLYFKLPGKNLELKLRTSQPSYGLRKPVNIDISSALAADDSASLSMAVYRIDSLQSPGSENILNYLLLTSDLRGYIEDPGYYFSSNSKLVSQAADNLMLTQGWRRFNWEAVLSGPRPAFTFAPELDGHIITGKLTDTRSDLPQQYITVFLSAPSPITQFKTAETDKAGMILFSLPNFFGGTHIVAQTNPLNDNHYKIEIDNPFSKSFSPDKLPVFLKPVSFQNTLKQQSISMQVQNLYVAEKMNQFQFPYFMDTASFYVHADQQYNLDNYVRFTTLEEVIREYVMLVSVRRKNKEVHFPVVNLLEHKFYSSDPLNLLDGVPVFDLGKFLEFDPLKIKSLDVIAQRYITGTSLFEGILNWKTHKPNLSNYSFGPNVLVMDYEGMQLEREFYSPVYDSEASLSNHLPDFRNVLQWSPDLKLTGKNETTARFYTGDVPGKYVIVVQGLSKNGSCGTAVTTFEVQ